VERSAFSIRFESTCRMRVRIGDRPGGSRRLGDERDADSVGLRLVTAMGLMHELREIDRLWCDGEGVLVQACEIEEIPHQTFEPLGLPHHDARAFGTAITPSRSASPWRGSGRVASSARG